MMRQVLALSSALLLASAVTGAADLSSTEAKRLSQATTVVREFKATPDAGIPESLWSRAECVTVTPNLKKAAFIVGGEYGKGVMSCRRGRTWSAPVFVELAKGSAGPQIGAEQSDVVLLMMNRQGVEKLLSDKVNLGADASVAAGPVGRTASASTDAQLKAGILAYSRATGAFAGINLSGGVLRPDKDANDRAYGTSIAARDVLFTSDVAVPASAQAFVRTLAEESRATSGRKR